MSFSGMLALMARIRGHKHLNEDMPLYAMRGTASLPWTVAGRRFLKGDPFPWHELAGVTPRLIRRLHELRYIAHEQPSDPAEGAEPVQPPDVRDRRAPPADAASAKRDPGSGQAPSRTNPRPVTAAQRSAR